MDITFTKVNHIYNPGSPFARKALDDINLRIPSGSFTSIIGQTGSGKSTLVQHIDGLLKPSSGKVVVGSYNLTADKKKQDLRTLRAKVGFVFQYPEHQLFDETIIKDVCFGPINFGVPQDEAVKRAEESLTRVGIPSPYWQRSPFDLSGGQMRRVAIAGVLAAHPEAIILDEPTAGLDPRGREEILQLFLGLNKERKTTIIMVTHNMNDAALYSDQVIVMNHGKKIMDGKPEDVFSREEELHQAGLDAPQTMLFLDQLNQKMGRREKTGPVFTLNETADTVIRILNGGADHV
jgi:energy-coupling factor transport system ATP-binding protein